MRAYHRATVHKHTQRRFQCDSLEQQWLDPKGIGNAGSEGCSFDVNLVLQRGFGRMKIAEITDVVPYRSCEHDTIVGLGADHKWSAVGGQRCREPLGPFFIEPALIEKDPMTVARHLG